jgi:ketosteroid isomerase-like protein
MDAGRPRSETDRRERKEPAARFFDALQEGDLDDLRELLAARRGARPATRGARRASPPAQRACRARFLDLAWAAFLAGIIAE